MKRILIIASDGFEQSELVETRKRLDQAGFETMVASPEEGEIRGWKEGDWGDSVPVDLDVLEVETADYDALVLPGGQMNPTG